MDLGITHKRALITGAGRGIGRAITLALADEGVHVACISRTKQDLDDIEDVLSGKKIQTCMIQADLTDENSISEIGNIVLNKFGSIDILINNLGGTLDIKDPFCSLDDWRKIWRLNMEVCIEFTNMFIHEMKGQKWGRIINIASIAALENQGPVPYCTVKAALVAYTRSMGRIVAPDGIIMASILPGAFFTHNGYWDITSKTNPDHVKKYLMKEWQYIDLDHWKRYQRLLHFFVLNTVRFA